MTASFTDALTLVDRLKASNPEKHVDSAVLNFENSLLLGPPIVQGQYDQNFRRFGSAYESGDQHAREKLKDIVINLQLTLLANLRMALLDGSCPDLASLQAVSDNGRLDALMCLHKLGQRVSTASGGLGNVPATSSPLGAEASMILSRDSRVQLHDPSRFSMSTNTTTSQGGSSQDARSNALSSIVRLTDMSSASPISAFSNMMRESPLRYATSTLSAGNETRSSSVDSSIGSNVFSAARYAVLNMSDMSGFFDQRLGVG